MFTKPENGYTYWTIEGKMLGRFFAWEIPHAFIQECCRFLYDPRHFCISFTSGGILQIDDDFYLFRSSELERIGTFKTAAEKRKYVSLLLSKGLKDIEAELTAWAQEMIGIEEFQSIKSTQAELESLIEEGYMAIQDTEESFDVKETLRMTDYDIYYEITFMRNWDKFLMKELGEEKYKQLSQKYCAKGIEELPNFLSDKQSTTHRLDADAS